MLDEIMPEAGAFYVMDRGYIDFERLFVLTLSSAFFVGRTKSNVLLQRRYSHPVDKSTGVRSDQTVILSSFESASAYPDSLRRVSYFDADTGKRLKFLTNNFTLPALTIARIYKQRWQVELFFKWIKQHLRIKAFYGTSENAVKTQIWIAVFDVRARGDRAQAVGAGGQPVPDSTDSQPHAFRENAHFMRTSGHRPKRQFRRKWDGSPFLVTAWLTFFSSPRPTLSEKLYEQHLPAAVVCDHVAVAVCRARDLKLSGTRGPTLARPRPTALSVWLVLSCHIWAR